MPSHLSLKHCGKPGCLSLSSTCVPALPITSPFFSVRSSPHSSPAIFYSLSCFEAHSHWVWVQPSFCLCLAWATSFSTSLPLLSFVHVHTQLASSSPLVPTCWVLFCTSWLSLLPYFLTSPFAISLPSLISPFLYQWAYHFTLSCFLPSFKLPSFISSFHASFTPSLSEKNYTSNSAW